MKTVGPLRFATINLIALKDGLQRQYGGQRYALDKGQDTRGQHNDVVQHGFTTSLGKSAFRQALSSRR